jgi:hypothetical protein
MLRNSFYISIIIIAFLNACTVVPRKDLNRNPKITGENYFKRVEVNFSKGEELIKNGEVDGSKYFFDRAINILLDSNSDNFDGKKPLMWLVDRIASLELSYLLESEPDDMDRHQNFLQEVIATPLFTPSKKDVSRIEQKLIKERPQYNFPIQVNSKVVSFLVAFQSIRHESIQNALNRSTAYIDTFRSIFRQYQIPEDLVYLPIIESGFRSEAVSRAGARGIWQFMASTARMFGLRVDWIVDERRDPVKATVAAAKYLKCLYDEYGDWYLALACYNGGTRRVNRAIQNLKTRDFFSISRTRYLRRETRNYIPAFLASLIIAKSYREYGFIQTETENSWQKTKIVDIPSPVDIKTIAGLLDIPANTLKALNPELIHDFTPFDKNLYSIRLPHHVDENIISGIDRLPPEKEFFVGWYRVKKGDNLYQIARKFNTTIYKIKKTNKLRSSLIKPGRRLLIPR